MGLLVNLQLTELFRSSTARETNFYFTHLGCRVPETENCNIYIHILLLHHLLSAVTSVTVNDQDGMMWLFTTPNVTKKKVQYDFTYLNRT
jgi:hypothetical protein